jgi:nucleotide-binding universal stress UspA family protein
LGGQVSVFKHLLIVLNAKKSSEYLLAHSTRMAHAVNAKVTIISHLDVTSKRIDPLDWHIRKIEAETQLNQLAERLQDAGIDTQVNVSETLEPGQLIEYAQSNQVDLILVSKQVENIDGMIHGLMKRTNIPILVVPQSGFLLNDGTTKTCYQNILIPLDGSQRAECTLPVASFLAQTCQSQLILAHVVRKPEMPRHAPLTPQETDLTEQIVESNRAEATHYLEQVATRLPGEVRTRLLINDNISLTIHRLADEEAVDLIVLSAHGYTGEPQWPYGSVTNSLIAYSTRPVLVVQDLPVSNSQSSTEQQIVAERSETRRS